MSSVFALPLSAEKIQEDASGAVTAVSDESPAIPEVTTVPEETTDRISEATEPQPELAVTESTPEVTVPVTEASDPEQEMTTPAPEATEPEQEVTEPLPEVDSMSEDLLLASAGDIVDSGFCGGEGDGTNLTWTLDSAGTLTISGTGKMSDFTVEYVPNENLVPWNQYLFPGVIKNVVISKGITSIGDLAFANGSGITSVTIPEGIVEIGSLAFWICSNLSSVTIPNSVVSIGSNAFTACESLTTINLEPHNNCYHKAGNCLIETQTGALIKCFDDSIIPDDGSVKSISSGAFSDCSKLTTIKIPSSVTYISDSFSECKSLSAIVVDPDNSYYHNDGNCLIDTRRFRLIKGFDNSVIPDDGSVKRISSEAFKYCSSMTSITIPGSVVTIDGFAFSDCASLKSIVIPKSVTEMGVYVFSNCSSLTDIYCEAESKPVDWDDNWISWYTGTGPTVHWGSTGPEVTPGEFNEDGEINMKDAVLFIGWIGAPFLPQFQINQSFNADFNKDGVIDMKDAVYYIGWIGAPFLPQFKIDW